MKFHKKQNAKEDNHANKLAEMRARDQNKRQGAKGTMVTLASALKHAHAKKGNEECCHARKKKKNRGGGGGGGGRKKKKKN